MIESKDIRYDALFLLSGNKTIISNNKNDGIEFVIMPNRKNPRWFIPNNKYVIKNIGNIVKPSSIKAIVIWNFAKFLNIFGLFGILFRSRQYIRTDILGLKYLNNKNSMTNYVIYTGAPGIYQKFTIQEMINGKIESYTKVGIMPLAKKRIELEYNALLIIKSYSTLKVNVPKIQDFYEKDNILFLRQSPGDVVYKIVLRNFNSQHYDFLRELQKIYKDVHIQLVYDKINKAIDFISNDDIFSSSIVLIKEALKRINSVHFDSDIIRLYYSHGDFSPWNCFSNGKDLFVFDWEMGDYRTPLWDYFNFIYHKNVLLDKGDISKLLRDLKETELFANLLTSNNIIYYQAIYLIDIIIHYCEQFKELKKYNIKNNVPLLINYFTTQLSHFLGRNYINENLII